MKEAMADYVGPRRDKGWAHWAALLVRSLIKHLEAELVRLTIQAVGTIRPMLTRPKSWPEKRSRPWSRKPRGTFSRATPLLSRASGIPPWSEHDRHFQERQRRPAGQGQAHPKSGCAWEPSL